MEGGMALTNNPEWADKMRMLRSHGITNNPATMTEKSHGPWYYQQVALGFNYRMTDVEAALGLSQLSKLSEFLESRNELARYYGELLGQYPGITPLQQSTERYSSYHLYVIRVENLIDERHAEIVTSLRENGIVGHVHYIPIHIHPYYKSLGFNVGDYPNAELYYQQAITLPLYPDLKKHNVDYIVENLVTLVNS